MAVLVVGVGVALDGPLSAGAAFVGILASAAASALALWLALSPFREKYADDPTGKRSPTLAKDTELINMLWWDVGFYFVLLIVVGFGAAFLLTQRLNLLTDIQGTLLQIFILVMTPLVAVAGSGGTSQRHLKAEWLTPIGNHTRLILRFGLGVFGLLAVYGSLGRLQDGWIGSLRTKGGLFFELVYVGAVAAAVWLGFSAIWRAVKQWSAADDERQAAARKARREAKAEKASPRPERATGPAQVTSAPPGPTTSSAEEPDKLPVPQASTATGVQTPAAGMLTSGHPAPAAPQERISRARHTARAAIDAEDAKAIDDLLHSDDPLQCLAASLEFNINWGCCRRNHLNPGRLYTVGDGFFCTHCGRSKVAFDDSYFASWFERPELATAGGIRHPPTLEDNGRDGGYEAVEFALQGLDVLAANEPDRIVGLLDRDDRVSLEIFIRKYKELIEGGHLSFEEVVALTKAAEPRLGHFSSYRQLLQNWEYGLEPAPDLPDYQAVHSKDPVAATNELLERAIEAVQRTDTYGVQSSFGLLKDAWGAENLHSGNRAEIEALLIRNGRRICSAPGFAKFEVKADTFGRCATMNALFDDAAGENAFLPIAVWQTDDEFFACGNADFK